MTKSYRYKLLISYDGTRYHGWQIQKTGPTVQSLIQEALQRLTKQTVVLIGAGRTDANVHALEQVAHFNLTEPLEIKKIFYALNGLLPHDIRIKKIQKVDLSFHARYSAKRKEYHYHITLNKPLDPFTRLYRHRCRFPLDVALMKKATQLFVGTKDFSSFANRNSSAKTSVRTIYRLDIKKQKDGIRIECEGNGFLYKMMRNIVGSLIDVGRKKISTQQLQEIFEKKNRIYAPSSAPGKGLFLVKIRYDKVADANN